MTVRKIRTLKMALNLADMEKYRGLDIRDLMVDKATPQT